MEATIIIKDEVNAKITGIDLGTKKKLVNSFKYEVPGSYFNPTRALGRWDGKISFFQLGGSTFVNLLPEILPILEKEGYSLALDDQRDYFHDISFTPVETESYNHLTWPEGHIHEGEPIVLRDYQVKVINSFLDEPQSIQKVATGAGKTLATAVMSHRCENHGRTIVIVPSKQLVEQTEEDYINMGLDVGVFYGKRKEFGRTHTICTWQSLGSLMKKTKAKEAGITIHEFLEGVIAVICDEVHGAKADVLKELLTNPMACIPIRWGLTGTIPKDDLAGASLLVGFGPVVGAVSAKELQDMGVLAKCHVHIQQLIDIKEYDNYQSELKYLLTDPARQDYIAEMIVEISKTGNTLVLVDRVQAGKDLVQKINERAPDRAVFISGAVKTEKRKEHYDEVKEVDDKIIVATYGVAAVGINIPRIFNMVLIEPGKSFVKVIQSIGRGLRVALDKAFVNIWDITSTCKFAKRHLRERKKYYKESEYPFKITKVDWS